MLILSVMHTYDLTLHLDLVGNRNRNRDNNNKKSTNKHTLLRGNKKISRCVQINLHICPRSCSHTNMQNCEYKKRAEKV